MERPINETFTTKDGVTLQVKESVCCKNCYFNNAITCATTLDVTGECSCVSRIDRKSVTFKQI